MTTFGDRPDSLGLRERFARDDLWHGCPCGTGERYFGEGTGARTRHAHWHLEWDRGALVPSSVFWFDSLAIVTGESSMAERKLAYKLGRLFQREQHYDFPMVPDPRSWPGELHQVLLAVHNCRAIGVLISYTTQSWGLWDGKPGTVEFTSSSTVPVPEISGIWVARSYRRRGVGTALVDALAAYADLAPALLVWGLPFSDNGKALALSIGGDAVRVGR